MRWHCGVIVMRKQNLWLFLNIQMMCPFTRIHIKYFTKYFIYSMSTIVYTNKIAGKKMGYHATRQFISSIFKTKKKLVLKEYKIHLNPTYTFNGIRYRWKCINIKNSIYGPTKYRTWEWFICRSIDG